MIGKKLANNKNVIDGILKSLTLLCDEKGIARITKEFENINDKRKIEKRINRAFFYCLKDIFQPQYNITPLPEFKIQSETDTPYHPSEEKEPDFSLELNDDLNESVFFHIECKRLGSPTSSSWIYNEEYVQNGIYRFTTKDYHYGIKSKNGAMVGYIEDMEFDDILNEVNQTIENQLKIEKLTKQTDWQEKSTTQLHHNFERPFQISPFTLHHFWIDLRGCYPRRLASCEIQSK